MITGNEPIQSFQDDLGGQVVGGLTIRQHFAAMAMQGFLSDSTNSEITANTVLEDLALPKETEYDYMIHWMSYVAKRSVLHADALIAELNKKP